MANFNLNKVILGGRAIADIELKQTPSGVAVCTFSVAVNRRAAKDAEQQVDFISCVAWRSTAEFIAKYFRKGSSICVVGNIQTRSWTDKDGNKRYATEVIVDEAYFVDSKGDAGQSAAPYIPDAYAPSAPQGYVPMSAVPTGADTDDELPF